MDITAGWLAAGVGTLAVAGSGIVSMPGRFASAAMQAGLQGTRTPAQVVAGVPFVVHDDAGEQIGISSRSGHPLSPYLLPVSTMRYLTSRRTGSTVHAGVPFILHDGYATLLCVSSYAGVSIAPFIGR